jgi:CHAT domain-containing protein
LDAGVKAKYPAYFALRHPQPVATSIFQRSVLKPGELALIYDVLSAGSAVWLVSRDHISLVRLAPGAQIDAAVDRVGAHVAGMLNLLDTGARARRIETAAARDLPGFAADGYALFHMLLPGPAAAAATHAKSLIVVPSGSLYRVAFETLASRDPGSSGEGHYLIEDVPVSYVPSISLLAVVRSAYAKPARGRSSLLAFANPTFGSDAPTVSPAVATVAELQVAAARSGFAGGVFPALPGTQVEGEAVRVALDASPASLVSGDAATRARVLALNASNALRTYRYVLFATHAVLPNQIAGLVQPAIVLAHPDSSDGLLTMSDIFGLAFDADFVALSACSTGVQTTDSSGEGISGLTRAFLFAGTPAISVTLWEVDDAAAPQLTPQFFAGMYARGLSPAEALRRAKLALLRSTQARFRHPYAWGPSVIFGGGDRPSPP